ncbi:helix-turn-helix domain-containing protein [Pedobacter metabolipauper]|uniref:AraC-like DNA-binding protein n=1 Tax=Pedobacter metabolipauper TaxID=425513 RepID=A0A4V3D0X7_9SPHI|nr:helix-turn-helix domain-containing protein [Pedobacter metabolipauper]TDQ08184.1 AraC-like DNA-binding protein [Pedobacter metabolipauper]
MNTSIVPLQHPALKAYIQYFIFFNHGSGKQFSYQTFPNTNLCLTIYKNNKINYRRNVNLCTVDSGSSTFSSRLFGFHEQPFKVDITTSLDQICILFNPGGLRAFTKAPYGELLDEGEVFECIFGNQNYLLENIFERNDPQERAALLEDFLAERLTTAGKDPRIQFALDHIYKGNGDISVYSLARSLKINESTLYRSFTAALGQSPKDFIQTVRFRNALSLLLAQRCRNLTELTYKAMFYDQSHFIKDFKMRSGTLPNTLHQNIRLEQHLLAWVIKP